MSTCSAFKSFQRFQLVPLEDRVVLVTTGVKAPVGYLKPSRLERKHQQKQAQKLRHDLGRAGKPYRLNPSHSIPVMTKDSVKCEIASDNIIYKFKNK